MMAFLTLFEDIIGSIPLPLLEVWGRFAYIVGIFLAICAFGGFTLRLGGRWAFGRSKLRWDAKAFLSLPLTSVLIIATGYVGSFIVLVPGAQTFESLKDLVVLLSIVLLGYPALISVPFAYGLSDLIEGVPPEFLLAWLPGYFINPACFWIAYQFIGKNPDFRIGRTWKKYLAAAILFLALEPVLWGYVSSDQFPSGISYHRITPALFFTTTITWMLGPPVFLIALPVARRFGWFWAEIPGRVRERAVGGGKWIWESGRSQASGSAISTQEGVPIRIFIFTPFIVLMLVMVGATAIVALRSADDDAVMLATKLHQQLSANMRMELDDYLARSPLPVNAQRENPLASLLRNQAVADGRAFILDKNSRIIASSSPEGDAVVESAVQALASRTGPSGLSAPEMEFKFDQVTAKPLSRQTWLTYATAYRDDSAGRDWILVSAMPEAFYLAGLRLGNSRAAMVFALALVLSLVLAAALASMVTAPLRRIARATQTMAGGDLSTRVPGTKLEELTALADSFNDMAAKLKTSFEDLVSEVDIRKSRERELKESETRLRASEDRLQQLVHELRRSTTYLTEAEKLSNTGCWARNIRTGEQFWSPGECRIFGIDSTNTQPSYNVFLELLHPDDRASQIEESSRAIEQRKPFDLLYRAVLRDGTVKHLHSVGTPVFEESGEVIEYLGVTIDETERVHANAAMQEAHAELTRVARLTTMGELAGSIAHEINQPLAAVVANANAALRWLTHDPPNFGETKIALERIINNGTRASEVIGRIRELLKHRTPEHAPLNLKEAIGEVLELTRGALRGRAVALRVALLEDVPFVLGDRVQLQQVIMNLIVNGADAMSSIIDRPRILSISAKHDNNGFVRVTIQDSGTGIDESIRHRIFDPLFTTKINGMGMGLAICRSIVEAHGGKLWTKPATPYGTIFEFSVPSADTAQAVSSQ